MKIIFTILLIAFGSFNLFAQSEITEEDYAIYAEVLRNIYTENFKPNGYKTSFVIFENTVKLITENKQESA